MEVKKFEHFHPSTVFLLNEHFKMTLKGILFKPQRREADEGVRISHLNPDTRMNSKDEFRQGTNITMRPIRGVGV